MNEKVEFEVLRAKVVGWSALACAQPWFVSTRPMPGFIFLVIAVFAFVTSIWLRRRKKVRPVQFVVHQGTDASTGGTQEDPVPPVCNQLQERP